MKEKEVSITDIIKTIKSTSLTAYEFMEPHSSNKMKDKLK